MPSSITSLPIVSPLPPPPPPPPSWSFPNCSPMVSSSPEPDKVCNFDRSICRADRCREEYEHRLWSEESRMEVFVERQWLGLELRFIREWKCEEKELMSVDYESEVEDDILPIFRIGEDFNYGGDCVLLLSTIESAVRHAIEGALATLKKLISNLLLYKPRKDRTLSKHIPFLHVWTVC